MVAAQIGTLGVGERELAAGLLEAMGPDMLVIADRGVATHKVRSSGFKVPAGATLGQGT